MKLGALVISLDFELMWGCHDWATVEGYGKRNVMHVRSVINRMLALFEKYDVHATFATVGLIFCKGKEEALKNKPDILPSYINKNLGAYKEGYIENIRECNSALYFAPDIIEKLKNASNIEIGTHTFAHYFCAEEGQSLEEFKADLKQMSIISKNSGVKIESIVFPKNMVDEKYIQACECYDMKAYRGNAERFFSRSQSLFDKIKNRVCRLLDAYINVGGYSSTAWTNINSSCGLINVQASRFLRPYNHKLRWVEHLKLKRIKNELIYAAQNGEMYHLWWHPHNFGSNIDENMNILESILLCYSECREKYNMKSFTMGECAEFIKNIDEK